MKRTVGGGSTRRRSGCGGGWIRRRFGDEVTDPVAPRHVHGGSSGTETRASVGQRRRRGGSGLRWGGGGSAGREGAPAVAAAPHEWAWEFVVSGLLQLYSDLLFFSDASNTLDSGRGLYGLGSRVGVGAGGGHLAADGSRRKDRGGRGRRLAGGGGDLAHAVDTLRPAGEADGGALGQWRRNVRWEGNGRRGVRATKLKGPGLADSSNPYTIISHPTPRAAAAAATATAAAGGGGSSDDGHEDGGIRKLEWI
uniref:Uncharacterized protein n=1 Tax=Oryza sativa subsp. japonica TaxID=39947 RepID=Q6ZCN8_ORYSJ|nr:hypothetical protein [Oryza sativa Japonica Group]